MHQRQMFGEKLSIDTGDIMETVSGAQMDLLTYALMHGRKHEHRPAKHIASDEYFVGRRLITRSNTGKVGHYTCI